MGRRGSRTHDEVRRSGHGPVKQNDFTTFFFSNFSNGFGEMGMLKIFQRWTRVKEVFISRRLNWWGRRFGFVRFFDVRKVGKLERELDQIYVGNTKLNVNIPKYHRQQGECYRVERKDARQLNTVRPKYEKMKTDDTFGNSTKKGEEVWEEKRETKSYVEAVKGYARRDWKEVGFKTQTLTLPWMECSAVGLYKAGLNFELLGEEFMRGGMNMVRVRSMGDNPVLLTPREGETMEELLKLNRKWFDNLFVSIKPWSTAQVVSHKEVWVRCYGLSISLWKKDCFARVVGDETTLISIDNATLLWENLQYARLKIRLKFDRFVGGTKKMKVNDHMLSIFVVEDSPAPDQAKILTIATSLPITFHHQILLLKNLSSLWEVVRRSAATWLRNSD